jgi:hypothetical protein
MPQLQIHGTNILDLCEVHSSKSSYYAYDNTLYKILGKNLVTRTNDDLFSDSEDPTEGRIQLNSTTLKFLPKGALMSSSD